MQILLLPAPIPPTDHQLALSAHNGDRHARNLLYLRHASLIRNRTIPAQRLADKLDASGAPINGEDVEQEAFLIFCHLLETWDPDRTSFVSFLSDSISRAAYMYVRAFQHLRSTRVKLIHTNLNEDPDLSDEESADPDTPTQSLIQLHLVAEDNTQQVIHKDFWDTIIAHLHNDWARLIHQRFWEDKSTEQIARTTGHSRRTIDRTIQSALLILQTEAAEEWDLR